jgi:hypothetical protein
MVMACFVNISTTLEIILNSFEIPRENLIKEQDSRVPLKGKKRAGMQSRSQDTSRRYG